MKKILFKNCDTKCSFTNEKGAILPTSILLLLVLALLVFVGAQWAQMDIKRTKDYTKTRQAFYVAETGIQMAINFLNYDALSGIPGGAASDGFDAELVDGDGSSWATGSDWPSETFQNFSYNGGTYTIIIRDNDDGDGNPLADSDNTVILTSTGIQRGGSSTIEAIVYRGEFATNNAFITEDSITMGGNYTINGDAHTNEGMTNNGDSGVITGSATAYDPPPCESPCQETETYEYIPLITEQMFEDFFKPLADVVLLEGSPASILHKNTDYLDLNTGLMVTQDVTYQKLTTTVPTNELVAGIMILNPNATFSCWVPVDHISTVDPVTGGIGSRCDNSDPLDPDPNSDAATSTNLSALQKLQEQFYNDIENNFGDVNRTGSNVWKFNGDKLPQNVYIYVEIKDSTYGGKITINNTPSPEWTVSIISSGAIDIQAGAVIDNYLPTEAQKPGLSEGEKDLFLMAGTDIELAGSAQLGSATDALEGFIYARDQIDFGGTVYMEGAVLARDDEPSPVNEFDGLTSINTVHGNFTLSFNSATKFPFPGPVRILSWREIEVVS